jgi:hypothetical protein
MAREAEVTDDLTRIEIDIPDAITGDLVTACRTRAAHG